MDIEIEINGHTFHGVEWWSVQLDGGGRAYIDHLRSLRCDIPVAWRDHPWSAAWPNGADFYAGDWWTDIYGSARGWFPQGRPDGSWVERLISGERAGAKYGHFLNPGGAYDHAVWLLNGIIDAARERADRSARTLADLQALGPALPPAGFR